MKTIYIQGKCFSCNDNGRNTALVTPTGTVKVQDSVAGHFTSCHNLTPEQEQVIREARDNSTVRL